MNIKPTEQQVREWAEGADEYADMKRKIWEARDLLRDQKLAELAAKWGAAQAQQTTGEEPELPEPFAYTYQNRYTDQHYLTWSKSEGGKSWVSLFTAAQMHDHFQAGVRAGAAGSQDANKEVVTMTVPLSHVNSLQVESIKRLVVRTKHAHMTDVRARINGNYEYFEADWLKYVVIGGGA